MSEIQKFHYLNAVISGEAARAIYALGISEENYTLAWEQIKNRYDDSDALIDHHVSKIFDAPTMTRNSYTELRHLIGNIGDNLLALKALKEKTEHWDTLILYLFKRKLSTALKGEWEKEGTNLKNRATLKGLTDFLEKQCKILQKTT